MKKLWKLLLALFLVFAGFSLQTESVNASQTRTVTDMQGHKVKIPRHVKRVADLWHANNQVVLLLGEQNKLVATTPLIKKQHWFVTIDPGIKRVTSPFSGNQIQTEELLKAKPDVVIASDPGQIKAAKQAKLPTVNAMYTNFSGLQRSVTLTAKILGGKAPKIAREYNKELNQNITLVQHQLKGVKNRPTVVHFVNSQDLTKVDGKKTIVDQWIRLAGGKNAISRNGNQITVTAESLIKANPDIIIVGSSTTEAAKRALKQDSKLKNLRAVKQGHVYGNPQGTFPWDRYSAEEALQVLWAAKKLHPHQMNNVNMTKETKDFYLKYYHYHLTSKQAHQILSGQN